MAIRFDPRTWPGDDRVEGSCLWDGNVAQLFSVPETLRLYRSGLFDNRKPISGVAKIYPV